MYLLIVAICLCQSLFAQEKIFPFKCGHEAFVQVKDELVIYIDAASALCKISISQSGKFKPNTSWVLRDQEIGKHIHIEFYEKLEMKPIQASELIFINNFLRIYAFQHLLMKEFDMSLLGGTLYGDCAFIIYKDKIECYKIGGDQISDGNDFVKPNRVIKVTPYVWEIYNGTSYYFVYIGKNKLIAFIKNNQFIEDILGIDLNMGHIFEIHPIPKDNLISVGFNHYRNSLFLCYANQMQVIPSNELSTWF